MSKLGIGRKALKKSLTYLLGHKWISLKGHRMVNTAGGEQFVKVYSINDIWRLNSEFYSKGVAKRTPLSQKTQRGVQKDIKGVAERAPNKNQYTNKNQEEEVSDEDKKKLQEIKAKAFGLNTKLT